MQDQDKYLELHLVTQHKTITDNIFKKRITQDTLRKNIHQKSENLKQQNEKLEEVQKKHTDKIDYLRNQQKIKSKLKYNIGEEIEVLNSIAFQEQKLNLQFEQKSNEIDKNILELNQQMFLDKDAMEKLESEINDLCNAKKQIKTRLRNIYINKIKKRGENCKESIIPVIKAYSQIHTDYDFQLFPKILDKQSIAYIKKQVESLKSLEQLQKKQKQIFETCFKDKKRNQANLKNPLNIPMQERISNIKQRLASLKNETEIMKRIERPMYLTKINKINDQYWHQVEDQNLFKQMKEISESIDKAKETEILRIYEKFDHVYLNKQQKQEMKQTILLLFGKNEISEINKGFKRHREVKQQQLLDSQKNDYLKIFRQTEAQDFNQPYQLQATQDSDDDSFSNSFKSPEQQSDFRFDKARLPTFKFVRK